MQPAFSRILRGFRGDALEPLSPAEWRMVRGLLGLGPPPPDAEPSHGVFEHVSKLNGGQRRKLLSSSPKTEATEIHGGFLNRILYLSPANLAGLGTVCPFSSPECRRACLNTSGRGRMSATQAARLKRTVFAYLYPHTFRLYLEREIRLAAGSARRQGKRLALRLDGTSDLGLAGILLASEGLADYWTALGVDFYDYTKSPSRAVTARPSWHVTYSAINQVDASRSVHGPGSVALVVADKDKATNHAAKLKVKAMVDDPAGLVSWWPGPVVNGDLSDARHLDPPGSLVLLSAKADALKPSAGSFTWRV